MLRLSAGFVAAFCGITLADAKAYVTFDPMKNYAQQIYSHNFDNVIGSNLPRTVSAVWYFHGSKRGDVDFQATWDTVAEKTKKMITIAAMDCEENVKHCEREGVKESGVMIYPQQPRPKFAYEGGQDTEAILKFLYKLIPGDKVKSLTKAEEYTDLKKKNPTKVKVILFSDKKKAPSMFKGLSVDSVFARTVEFSFVGPDASEVSDAAGAGKKKLPAIQIITKGNAKWYKEKDLSFSALHEWINLFSESGMGDTVKGAGAEEVHAEEAEYEKVRELHTKSQGELCFKQKNVCAIWLQEGDSLDDKNADAITAFENKFAPKSDRGIKYNWMWMDVAQEPEFKNALIEQEKKQAEKEGRDVEEFTYPTMIFVKPPKKKREEKLLSYIRMPSGVAVNDGSVGDVIERISGGAMYTRVDLPRMAVRQKKAAKGGKKEEL